MSWFPRAKSQHFRPQRHTLALEPRILFDGAAASAASDLHPDQTDDSAPHATQTETSAPAPRSLLVLDARLENKEQLLGQLSANVTAIVVNGSEDGLAAISAALAQLGQVDSIQVLSHGAAGQFTLGNRTVSAESMDSLGQTLRQWGAHLSAGADIQLYGCSVGAGEAGKALVSELARWTGADVAASNNATGASAAGGDWTLETRVGLIDKSIALSAAALAGFDGLLADAAPSVSLGSGGSDVLLGDSFTFTVNFSNSSDQVGYAPFINLFMPSTGKDGDDGVKFISASYLGQNLVTHVVTFDAAGNASHPLAKDASGNAVVINAASFGLRAGDQLVVVELPFASVSNGQPVIPVQVTASLSNLADTNFSNGSPDLTIRASGGFQFGNDALDNPTNDPSLIASGASAFVVHPTVIMLDQTLTTPEGETATGPNYGRTLTVTVTPAPGQTLTNVVVTQPLPDNVQVTAITPGAGGRLTSITLHDGTVVTDPAAIATLIAADDIFISSFSVEYASLAAATATVVDFYVPEVDATGKAVLDPVTGNPVTITLGAPTTSGEWAPLDPRDITSPNTSIDFTGTGKPTDFLAKSITLLKQVTLQTDIGQTGISPGDTLRYNLNLAISDYFAFGKDFFNEGQLIVRDQFSDGQILNGTPTLTVTLEGVQRTITLVTTTVTNADGSTSMAFDIAESLRNAFGNLRGWLNGDLAFDTRQEGAVLAVISYAALVGQAYQPPAGLPHNEINEGDELGNSAVVAGTLLLDIFNLTGQSQSDDSTSTSVIPTNRVNIDLVEVNNGMPPGNGELRPGDEVTFEMRYDLVTGDYEQFKLTAYLPMPLFNVSGLSWTVGDSAGQWQIGPGNTNAGSVVSVSAGDGNSLVFDFGSYVTADTTGSRIVVRFTLKVGDQPFADQRSLDVLAQSSQQTTLTDRTLVSSDIAVITSIAEPVLSIKHGVVSSSNGTVSNVTGSWNAPGSSGQPFNGSVTELASVNGDVSGIDGGDRLRLVTAIENSGGGGAWDVTTSITLPTGLGFVGGSLAAANLQIYRGDGTALVAGVDYRVSGQQITFLDAGGQATLLAGRSGTSADTSGANLVVISYDVLVSDSIAAGRSLQSLATLNNYASVNGGSDFTPVDLTDLASQQIAAPVITKTFADGSLDNGDSSAAHTTGSDLVVGESMRYDIRVTLPEGSTQTLRIEDLIPPGLRLDTSFNNGLGYQLITTRSESAALAADFSGSVTVSSFTGQGGSLGADGADARWTFSAVGANADNRTDNNSFVIRVQLVASNVIANQANKSLQNSAQLFYSDPDGDTPNGNAALDRSVHLSGGAPTVTLREPTVQINQALTSAGGPGGYDQGDVVNFTITLSNGTGTSNFDAFDISLLNNLPSQLNNVTLTGVLYQNGATNNGGVDFEIVGGQLRTVGNANIDIAKGGSIVLSLSGVVNATAASQASFNNVAEVQWTSLDGTTSGERTGVDGQLNSGLLNDYRNISALVIPVAQAIQISRVAGLPDTPAPSPTTAPQEAVTIGELIRYRVVVMVPEGDNPNYQVQITLANGLQFISPDALGNALRIAFISNGGLSSDASLIVGGTLDIDGNEHSGEALPITPGLNGLAPQGIFDPTRVSVATRADGSQVVTFNLGNVVNGNGFDDDLEGVVLEFNVRVNNQASNIAGATLGVHASEYVNGNARASSDTLYERIVEPSFNGLDKQVIGFDPTPGGSSGKATVQLNFTQDGGLPAYDAQLRDSFTGGSNYSLLGISINGTSYGPGNLPAGVTFSDATGISVDFSQLNVGDQVSVRYEVTLSNATVIASSDATLTWTSLPETFTSWGGSAVGSDGAIDGERTGSGTGPNRYILTDKAGLGIISGTLWNDTASATASTAPDGPGLAGQTVTLTWAGIDGRLDTSADNLQFSTVTDANGQYHFGVLPLGVYRIDAPVGLVSYPQPLGDLRVRIDTDGGTLGQIVIRLGDADTQSADAGYVEQNDAPVNRLPGNQNGLEDIPLAIGGISVSDVDAERDPDSAGRAISVTLSVLHGTLSVGSSLPGVAVSGANTASLTLTGNLADLNTVLASLLYLGNANFNGTDTLTVLSNDNGNYGDYDGNGTPGQPSDARTDQDTLAIILAPVNDAPVAVDDAITAVEAGGTRNNVDGIDPRGNLISNDVDVDIATNADRLHVVSVGPSNGTAVSLPANGVVVIVGQYGSLLVGSNGSYEYRVDNSNPAVEALRLAGQTLVDRFDYVVSDLAGATDSATLTVTIEGANDTPVGVDDEGTAVEAGGVLNGTPGQDATGNVLTNDTDIDSVANGETKTVSGIRLAPETTPGSFTTVNAATTVVGLYGTLTINPDGSYRYVVDNDNVNVQRLSAGQQLSEVFSYRLTDAGGLDDVAQLRITIEGANDNPVASDDAARAQAASTNGNAAESNPAGNVIWFPSRPGSTDNGVDTDVDQVDRPNTLLQVNGVINKSEASYDPLTDALVTVPAGSSLVGGVVVNGLYGRLVLGADGSYAYDVDSTNAAVQALAPGQTLTEYFTYRVVDTAGLTDTAQLVITVHGVNDPPVAQNLLVVAVERGGVNNGTPGVDPSGDVTAVAHDPEGDPINVVLIKSGGMNEPGMAIGVAPGGTQVFGAYGSLTIYPDGTYTYALDNTHADVQALRQASDLLLERFTFTVGDNGSPAQIDAAEIIVLISGRNDAPVAVDDSATAIEAGGLNNGTPGADPAGNVLDNDSDVDGYGETRAVASVRTGTETGSGAAGTLGQELRGNYGWLRLNADGSYSYRVDNDLAAVQALRDGQSLEDAFSYTVIDAAGAQDRATLTIHILGRNDTPIAQNDTAIAVEAGGLNNGTPGADPTGNVLVNDSDVDGNDALQVIGVRQGGSIGTIGSAFTGLYGTLTLAADGSYSYAVDNDNPLVQSLRTSGEILRETFTYQIRDLAGATSAATLTVAIRGANDNPVAADDTALAVEAGGTANGTPGINPTGNVLANDRDVDANDSKTVTGIRTGTEAAGGTFTTLGSAQTIAGTFGTLTINADGTYRYVVNNDLAAVQALKVGDNLFETFTYRLRDTAGATDDAQLSIRIDGAWDAPLAVNDTAVAVADDGSGNGVNPTRNALENDSDIDQGDQLQITGIRLGTETAGGSLTGVSAGTDSSNGTLIDGLYGQLIIGSDGSYTYIVDSSNPTVIALGPQQFLDEHFTYQVTDRGGLSDQAEIHIIVRGRNDAPVANDDSATAVEAGGVFNGTPGQDATGNVLTNDTDVDSPAGGETKTVTGIRHGPEANPGSFTAVNAATTVVGLYGTLTINPDGSFRYVVNNDNVNVQRLSAGQQLSEVFSYRVTDAGGLDDVAQLRITIEGANDNPVASDDAARAQAASTNGNAAESNPAGNVIWFPSRPGTSDNGIDDDVDQVDRPNTQLQVNGVINKSEASYDPLSDVLIAVPAGSSLVGGVVVNGLYGRLVLGADGSYAYDVDSTNPTVQNLGPGQTLTEYFTYRVVDTAGLTDTAQLVITVHGVNDPPVAQNNIVVAVERGGVNNDIPGLDPSGDVTSVAHDPEGDPINVVLIKSGGMNEPGMAIGVAPGGTQVFGSYGSLTIHPDGTYTYVLNNDHAQVQALRQASDLLLERFTFTIGDNGSPAQIDAAEIIVLISGRNDAPVAVDDSAMAIEAGGLNNGTPGADPAGNVLDNDSDVDGYGETRAVASVRTGTETGSGAAGTLGQELRGNYGWLTLNADGSYSYRVDNDLAAVQALRDGQGLDDAFSYTVMDAAGAQDRATLTIHILGRNDTPIAQNDTAIAVEAGGLNNGTPGADPTGNVLVNDSDVDGNDALQVIGVRQGSSMGAIGSAFAGLYGTLTLAADGSYSYAVDNDNPLVQALRTSADTLRETFTYQIRDLAGATSAATLTVVVRGANDNPVAADDTALAVEAGGTANSTPGINPTGNVLNNDRDVDATDTKTVTGIRSGLEAAGGTFITLGGAQTITGTYGTLTINADGTYSYVIDNSLAAVQALKVGDNLFETFTYRLRDTAGATDDAQLSIRIDGAWDAPLAVNDTAVAVADDGSGNGVNPTRNALENDSDIDQGDQLQITGIRLGTETAGGSLTGVSAGTDSSNGTLIDGLYGQLIIGADGSYTYIVDSSNPTVIALGPQQFLDEHFTYQVTDRGGLSDQAEIHIIVRGRNDAPVAHDDSATAVEAGGVFNGTPGQDATGNVLTNDTDVDNGDTKAVTGIRHGPEANPGSFTAVDAATTVVGLYGTLTINPDGSYRYVVDNDNINVQRLSTGQQLSEVFSYRLTDSGNLSDVAQLRITIEGANDNPVASDDAARAQAASTNGNAAESNPAGNVIWFPSRPGSTDNGVDTDVDQVDRPNTLLQVNGVINKSEASYDPLSDVLIAVPAGSSLVGGVQVTGLYGRLVLGADGAYAYDVDSTNAAVQALAPGQTLSEYFTYRVVDTAGLTDTAQLVITVHGVNDPPVAQNNIVVAVERGGVNNGTPGVDPSGDVTAVAHDPEGDPINVVLIKSGGMNEPGMAIGVAPGGTQVFGSYGSLTIHPDGTYTYVLNNDHAQVQALRLASDLLLERFTFTIGDNGSPAQIDAAEIIVLISGRNDAPVAVDDSAMAIEAGGLNNGTPGVDAIGNVLDNDRDVDANDSKTVTGIRTGTEAAGGTFTTLGGAQTITGTYGTLTINADGTYRYVIDNGLAAVQALKVGDNLLETFTYRLRDTAGATDDAQLSIRIDGAWDAPLAVNDTAVAVADDGSGNGVNPTRNALENDSDVDQGDRLQITGIRLGKEAAGGSLTDVNAGTDSSNGSAIDGLYGQLIIGADGSYTYLIDSGNPSVIALGPLDFLDEHFTYQVTDRGGLSDQAEIHIIVRGRNYAPVAHNDSAMAVEAGGMDNGTPGINPSGNVLRNDTDPENDALSVAAIRTGSLTDTGTAGALGTALRGRYGDLVIHADGSYTYTVDNGLAEVQALRQSGQTLSDVFSYTLVDAWGATDRAELLVTVDGRNDTPIARDDSGVALEAGGVDNATPGRDATGNVLDNDSDVDSSANGETRQVVEFSNETGQSGAAGQVLTGRYGQLRLNADGSYTYVLDNANAAVQALRTSSDTLRETFSYRMRDAAGATADARLTIIVQGASDAPVARDDSNVASDQVPAPQSLGNVLPNDSDIDTGDALHVSAIRTGTESGSGSAGAIGQPLKGQYGTLVLQADGSYSYSIDLGNPEVLSAAGLGRILHDSFTYTVQDRAGGSDQAVLVITLDISSPFIPPQGEDNDPYQQVSQTPNPPLFDRTPAIFITPVVERDAEEQRLSQWRSGGSRMSLASVMATQSDSLGAGLGLVPGQFVAQSVRDSRTASDQDLAWIMGREGRTGLNADGLLSDPSLFTADASDMTRHPSDDTPESEPRQAPPEPPPRGFSAQLRNAAERLHKGGRV